MMNLKQIFCKHEWVFTWCGSGTDLPSYEWYNIYQAECIKCGKIVNGESKACPPEQENNND